ncbi:MAG: hypothetical protein K8S20_11925 [Chloroflexi bacterium]|nr:hypothetical protein [Chloroflexota bacterium]
MPIQNVVGILAQIEAKAAELEMAEAAENYVSGSWGLAGSDTHDAVLSSEEIASLRPRLVQALLELSAAEGQELLQKVKGTAREKILSQTTASKKIPARQKFRIVNLLWPDFNIASKTVDGALREIRSRQPNYDMNLEERKEFLKTKERGMAILVPLKELIEGGLVDDEFVALALDVMVFRDMDDIEAFSKQLTHLILNTASAGALEQLSVIWSNLVPETVDRKLGPLLLSADPKEKESARRILVFMGRNPMTVVEGDQIMGDVIHMSGDFRGANVPVKSTLKDVAMTISGSSAFDEPTKQALAGLIQQLDDVLSKSPEDKAEDAKAVADTAHMLVQTAAKDKPNPATVQITAEGLKKAALNLAFVLPAVVPIVKQIIALLVP